MRQHFSLLDSGKAAGGLPGSEPHSGNPTVRDRRGAYGNVDDGWGYSGTYRGNAETAKPGPKVARAVLLSRPGLRVRSPWPAAKERDKLTKQLEELRRFDEQLRHYADQRIAPDLDDGCT